MSANMFVDMFVGFPALLQFAPNMFANMSADMSANMFVGVNTPLGTGISVSHRLRYNDKKVPQGWGGRGPKNNVTNRVGFRITFHQMGCWPSVVNPILSSRIRYDGVKIPMGRGRPRSYGSTRMQYNQLLAATMRCEWH